MTAAWTHPVEFVRVVASLLEQGGGVCARWLPDWDVWARWALQYALMARVKSLRRNLRFLVHVFSNKKPRKAGQGKKLHEFDGRLFQLQRLPDKPTNGL